MDKDKQKKEKKVNPNKKASIFLRAFKKNFKNGKEYRNWVGNCIINYVRVDSGRRYFNITVNDKRYGNFYYITIPAEFLNRILIQYKKDGKLNYHGKNLKNSSSQYVDYSKGDVYDIVKAQNFKDSLKEKSASRRLILSREKKVEESLNRRKLKAELRKDREKNRKV